MNKRDWVMGGMGMAMGLVGCAERVVVAVQAEPVAEVRVAAPAVVQVAPGTDVTIKRGNAATGEKAKVTIETPQAPTLPPTRPVGTIEMSDFKPIHEDVKNILRVSADKISTDASGLMTLSGNALVELLQGPAVARLRSDEITIQTGPGFKPEVGGKD